MTLAGDVRVLQRGQILDADILTLESIESYELLGGIAVLCESDAELTRYLSHSLPDECGSTGVPID